MIPGGEPAKPKQIPLRGVSFLFMTFTEQVLFGHSKNKTTPLEQSG
jgi:hypothetical protein